MVNIKYRRALGPERGPPHAWRALAPPQPGRKAPGVLSLTQPPPPRTARRSVGEKRFWQSPGGLRMLYGLEDLPPNAETARPRTPPSSSRRHSPPAPGRVNSPPRPPPTPPHRSCQIIIVEGEMDRLAFEQAGISNVVSIPDGAVAKAKARPALAPPRPRPASPPPRRPPLPPRPAPESCAAPLTPIFPRFPTPVSVSAQDQKDVDTAAQLAKTDLNAAESVDRKFSYLWAAMCAPGLGPRRLLGPRAFRRCCAAAAALGLRPVCGCAASAGRSSTRSTTWSSRPTRTGRGRSLRRSSRGASGRRSAGGRASTRSRTGRLGRTESP